MCSSDLRGGQQANQSSPNMAAKTVHACLCVCNRLRVAMETSRISKMRHFNDVMPIQQGQSTEGIIETEQPVMVQILSDNTNLSSPSTTPNPTCSTRVTDGSNQPAFAPARNILLRWTDCSHNIHIRSTQRHHIHSQARQH